MGELHGRVWTGGKSGGKSGGLQTAGQRDSSGGGGTVCVPVGGGLSGRVGPHWRDELAV